MPRSEGEIKTSVTMRMPDRRSGCRHMDAIMHACEVVRRARRAKFPEMAVRSLEADLASALERWRLTREWYENNAARTSAPSVQ